MFPLVLKLPKLRPGACRGRRVLLHELFPHALLPLLTTRLPAADTILPRITVKGRTGRKAGKKAR